MPRVGCGSGRYDYFLSHQEELSRPETTGGPVAIGLSTLDGLAAYLVLAITHHRSLHPRFGAVLERLGQKQLVQVRLDPDTSSLGLDVFDSLYQRGGFVGEPVFFDAAPKPGCPDCGGTGDLCDITPWVDTRNIRW